MFKNKISTESYDETFSQETRGKTLIHHHQAKRDNMTSTSPTQPTDEEEGPSVDRSDCTASSTSLPKSTSLPQLASLCEQQETSDQNNMDNSSSSISLKHKDNEQKKCSFSIDEITTTHSVPTPTLAHFNFPITPVHTPTDTTTTPTSTTPSSSNSRTNDKFTKNARNRLSYPSSTNSGSSSSKSSYGNATITTSNSGKNGLKTPTNRTAVFFNYLRNELHLNNHHHQQQQQQPFSRQTASRFSPLLSSPLFSPPTTATSYSTPSSTSTSLGTKQQQQQNRDNHIKRLHGRSKSMNAFDVRSSSSLPTTPEHEAASEQRNEYDQRRLNRNSITYIKSGSSGSSFMNKSRHDRNSYTGGENGDVMNFKLMTQKMNDANERDEDENTISDDSSDDMSDNSDNNVDNDDDDDADVIELSLEEQRSIEEMDKFSEETEAMRQSVYNFFSVPFELEKFIVFGFFICLDAYLFYFTFLPLRLLFGLFQLVVRRRPIRSAHLMDMIRALSVIVTVVFVIWMCDYSKAYHYIRGESTLKLYVMYNMLEVFDRLCCSFGQDIQSAMTFMISDLDIGKSSRKHVTGKVYIHACIALVMNAAYTCIHSLIQLYRVITLNVALNSSNNALWTLLVSNNFVELKGSVFKKFASDNLFQLACGDVVERFQLVVFGILIYMQNARAAVFGGAEVFLISITLLAEVGVDATKHAFVTKFNNIKSQVYGDFKEKLCENLTSVRNNESFLDNTSSVSRQIGFVEVPLIALSIRVMIQSMPSVLPLESVPAFITYTLGYCCLFALKLLLSIIIVGYSSKKLRVKKEIINQTETVDSG